MQAPALLPHQTPPLKHLALRCKQQHGLLVYHQMGTGKTRTVLGLTFEFPDDPWVILLPGGLQPTWIAEIRKFAEAGLQVPIRPFFVDYSDESLEAFFASGKRITDKTIVVFEEAHNFVPFYNKNNQKYKLEDQLGRAKKVLALTGTPVFNGLSDLRILINLVAGKGKRILPVDEGNFLKEYFFVEKKVSAWQGWIAPLVNSSYGAIIPALYQLGNHVVTAMTVGLMMMAYVREKLDMTAFDYHVPDTEKIHKACRPYISFHAYTQQDRNFPTAAVFTKEVDYTQGQIDLWLKTCQGLATPDQLASLGFDTSAAMTTDTEVYLSQGRLIGNAYINGEPPPRFVQIKEAMKQGSSIVIYSNFLEEGSKAFAKFLGPSYRCEFLMKDQTQQERDDMLSRFKQGKIQVLFLHPALIEGISIEGATQLHIMEPLMTLGATEQVIARVVRYQSHHHLPESKRYVEIYHWFAVPHYFMGRFAKKIQETKLWLTRGMFAWFTRLPMGFPSAVAPEGYIQSRAERNVKFLQDFIGMLRQDSLDKDDLSMYELHAERKGFVRPAQSASSDKSDLQPYLSITDMLSGMRDSNLAEGEAPATATSCPPCVQKRCVKVVRPKVASSRNRSYARVRKRSSGIRRARRR